MRKNIQYITSDEIDLLRDCADKGLIPLRDKAILFLLLYTGIRGCDIAGLTFSSIDWKSDRLHFIQRKTLVPLALPLSPIVGNAIFDYITVERPANNDEHIFLSKRNPHFPLTARGIGTVINGVMKKASIRQNPDDRKGTHIFRHHAATSMLEKGVPRPVITHALGHTAPDSLDTYLYADFVHLKECSIGIEEYPVDEEVFAL
jgi:integrase